MDKDTAVAAIYTTHGRTELAMKALRRSGFCMEVLSVAGRPQSLDLRRVTPSALDVPIAKERKQVVYWGGLWGHFLDSAFFWFPDLGPVMVAGPVVPRIVEALDGAIERFGLSALATGFCSMGFSRSSILQYESALKADKFVVVAQGYPLIAARARELINGTQPEMLEVHTFGNRGGA